jgi:predicted DNA-binding transcriptional regulator AlpA
MSALLTPSPPPGTSLHDRVFDARQLAQLLGVRPSTILTWAKSGVIPRGRRFSRRILRWTAADVTALLASERGG